MSIDPSYYAINYAKFFNGAEQTITEQKISKNNENVLVTVICITYNHELYIQEALESFVSQKTNFKFKVFVGDDCSSDDTPRIIEKFAKQYPDIIVPFLRNKNMGAERNMIDLCNHALSPYIAFCEGDDFWIDESKLQKQADFMNSHKEYAACCCNVMIKANEDWSLASYYRKDDKGRMLMPWGIPNFNKQTKKWTASEYIRTAPCQTSSFFIRWNYDLPIPESFFHRGAGDHAILMMQTGKGIIGFLPDVMSCYRRSDVGVTMSYSIQEHFLKTRLIWVGVLEDLKHFFSRYFGTYASVDITERMKKEATNYLTQVSKTKNTFLLAEFLKKYPETSLLMLSTYLSFYQDSRALVHDYSWNGYKLLNRNRYVRKLMKPLVHIGLRIAKSLQLIQLLAKRITKYILSFIIYWGFSAIPKRKNLWVFSGFRGKSYLDNTKYLYEYIVKNHPEIQVVWVTNDQQVYSKLKSENMPVVKSRTLECLKIMSRASVGFFDHFIRSDFDTLSGFNNKIKTVQLWHGVGLKDHLSIVKNTTFSGVYYKRNLFSDESDSLIEKCLCRIRYFFAAPVVELFENYFLLLCPGEEQIQNVAKVWGVPEKACFICGYPRNINLYTDRKSVLQESVVKRVLYAPTFRWSPYAEKSLINLLTENADYIQEKMSELNAELTVRLHPHTWRNYNNSLQEVEKKFSRIKIDKSKDGYKTLGNYDVLITDYSSIAYDFVLIDRPVVFFNFDFNDWLREESLKADYGDYTPGPKVQNWKDCLDKVKEYLLEPKRDQDRREKVKHYFYNVSANDKNNSERIVQEVLKRLDN